jgi:hypothetical protein
MGMRHTRVKYLVDLGMLVAFLLCFATGIVKCPGFLPAVGLTPHTVPLFQLSVLHDRSGLALGTLVLVHLLLNRRWMVAVTKDILARGW